MNGRVITLNSQQVNGLETMDKWYASGDLFIRILGYAGTGKTTISKHFLDLRSKEGVSIITSAPTHKAKRVISSVTGYEGKTIQALLGLGLDVDIENFDPNDPVFSQTREPEINGYKILLIDEGSMLNYGLTHMILTEAEQHNTRVIILCDGAQLPPVAKLSDSMTEEERDMVMKKISPVTMIREINWQVELTQVERQKEDNPLMPIYDKMRDNLNKNIMMYPQEHQINEKGEGIKIFHDNTKFAVEMIRLFRSEQEKGMTKVLCYRNVSVRAWNGFVRMALFGKAAPTLMKNELLMSYSNVRGKIQNSAEYVIEEIEETTACYDQTHETFGKVLRIQTGQVKIWRVKLMDLMDKSKLMLDIVKPEDWMVVAREDLRFKGAAKSNRSLWVKYFDWRAKFYVTDDVFVNNRKVLKKDLDYGYAMTVHKSQGSTYNDVFLDDPDFARNSDTVERNKLRYVALSRPRLTATVLL